MRIAAILCGLFAVMAMEVVATPPRCIMYLTGQHPVVPQLGRLGHVTHVALAFMRSEWFNEPERSQWPFWADVGKLRQYFTPETKIMVAIGGWGDVAGFERAAKSEESRQTFAASVAKMVETTGADGVDIDWEYPGGNGDDYKKIPNSKRAWEIEAYPLLLAEIRDALGKDRLISAAVPGLERDMMAFTRLTVPRIMRHIDFLNVMTYDLMNRRDNVTKHHTGIENSIEAVDAYVARGAAPQSINLGFAFYTKFIRTEHDDCANAASPLGCKTLLLEDPDTGADLGRTGGFSYHDEVPEEVAESWARAQWAGVYDEEQGGYYYWDPEENLWWTFDTPEAILKKFPAIVEKKRLGGVFAWGLGEDAPGFEHLAAVNEGLTALKIRKGLIRDEL